MKILIALLACVLGVSAQAQVPFERLMNADKTPGDWLTYSGNFSAWRYSSLDQINRANVTHLRPAWVYQVQQGYLESTPLVADGVMYLSEPPSSVVAIDTRSGRSLWHYERTIPDDLRTLGFGRTNRGVALLDGNVYIGTLDAHLVALDAKTGSVRWDVQVADYKTSHCITGAPLAIDGAIITGISGGEAGIRGFVDAYDAKTGKRLWRFWTVPAPGEPGHETWAGNKDAWKTGGGPTWVTGSYDPESKTIFWGTGNPGPDWNGDERPGDNLYTCSLLALDAVTGKLKWHFQYTPHDEHDWDATEIPVLFDATVRGKTRKAVAMANRNAFYYLLDRDTGEFLSAAPFAKQTWAKGIDDKGRPELIPGMSPSTRGTLVYPSLQGAVNWYSPSYSPASKLFYVSTREMGSYYFKTKPVYAPGTMFTGGGELIKDKDQASGKVVALDAATGVTKWSFPLQSPPWSGVLATAGGVVFGTSNEGNFFALNDATGKPLWDFQTGGPIRSNPISFLADGKQYVAIAAGRAMFVFGLN
jgi:alcohol dehydrogenase (cytochrome c)